jgi:hypothetical protein
MAMHDWVKRELRANLSELRLATSVRWRYSVAAVESTGKV